MSRIISETTVSFDSISAMPDPTAKPLQDLAQSIRNRRAFLKQGLTAAVAAPAAVLAAGSTANAAKDTSYTPGSQTLYFREIQADETTHVGIVQYAIKTLGGTSRPFPTFKNITNLTAAQFLQTAIAFENTGVHAYFGAAPYISNPNVVSVALSLALVEGYHSGFLNSTGGMPLIPGGVTYATPYTQQQVVAAVSPYIVSLNDNGEFPAAFSTTPSPQNDIAILNFALLLEMLEYEFYTNNVPRLFP